MIDERKKSRAYQRREPSFDEDYMYASNRDLSSAMSASPSPSPKKRGQFTSPKKGTNLFSGGKMLGMSSVAGSSEAGGRRGRSILKEPALGGTHKLSTSGKGGLQFDLKLPIDGDEDD